MTPSSYLVDYNLADIIKLYNLADKIISCAHCAYPFQGILNTPFHFLLILRPIMATFKAKQHLYFRYSQWETGLFK